MGNIGVPELLVILLIVLVLFGSKKIPELAQGLGKGIREFRKASRELNDDDEQPPRRTDSRRIEEKSSS
ncbi:MAG TPA: twin-arginine translocase TatA/TatE family subunit [Bacteroidota bacterium]|nr:twin-arginine translocase TatA/TatE family subunit [Bacteroidota bacterium]